jgi:1,5-anhydro-D-fructose reductase (1,5-anhydro-D-mannitol-forming)
MESQKTRWGVAGLGNVVTGRFAPALSRSSRSVFAACSTRDPAKAQAFAEKHRLSRVYSSFEELAQDPEIEVIYLATPNSLHYEQARLALQGGKHVLCEKPLALSLNHGRELIDLAHRHGRILRVAYQFRFESIFERVRDCIRRGEIGELRSVRLFGSAASVARATGWRENPTEGGILADLAVHFLDLIPWMTGLEFTNVSARANPTDVDRSSTDTITILGSLGDGCHGLIAASREASHGQNTLSIEGSKGTVLSAAWRGVPEFELTIIDASGRRTEKFAPSPIFEREIEAFEDDISGHGTNLATGSDGLRAIALAESIRDSVRIGKSVLVTDWQYESTSEARGILQ